MIILRLRGGLGNQLFQFAAAKALADHHGTDLKLDLYYYKKHPYRTFDLLKFNVPWAEASRPEVHQFTGSNPLVRLMNKRDNYFRCPEVFAQPHYHYFPDWLNLPSNLYLSGYFQSEKFFKPIEENIRTWYQLTDPLDEKNEQLRRQMQACESVAVHVRRGDYTAAQFNAFFTLVPEAYYLRAIDHVKSTVQSPKFFVFSDDPEWCRKNLPVEKDAVFVDHNKGTDSFKDLVMMSYAKHNIIANSSFSWWGAWLNANHSKVIVAPKRWFGQTYFKGKETVYPSRFYNTTDLIPENWTRL